MASITLQSPYPPDGAADFVWLKGNLHAHSTRSDGTADIQDVIRGYAALGHDFLQVSDHDLLADYAGLDPCGLALIDGAEVSAGGPHMLNVGGRSHIEPGERQQAIDRVNAAGGLAVLCHPNWERAFDHIPVRQLRALRDYCGLEIFNGGVYWGKGSGLAVDKWDMVLSAGRTVWGFANDDAHAADEIGRAWNVAAVRPADRSAAGVLDALRRGAFYASTGVTIESIACSGSTLHVVAPDAEAIAIQGEYGKRFALVEDTHITFDAAELTSPFIRVDCFGRGDRRAWSQPILLVGPVMDRLGDLLSAKPALNALGCDRAVRLTGRIDDPLWSGAEPVTQFYRFPQAEPPPVATEVRALLAGEVLYLAVRCEEPNMAGLRTAATAHQGNIWADDSIEVFLDPEDRGETYYHIQANAAGEVVAQHSSGRRGWPGLVALAGRYPKGWQLELAIPLAGVAPGGETRPVRAWGFNIHRNRAQDRSNMSWSWGGLSYHSPEHFGRIVCST